MPSEDNQADLGTKNLERDRIKKCVTKMGIEIAGAWAGDWLPVVSGTEVLNRRTDGGSELDDRCCVAHHSWNGTA